MASKSKPLSELTVEELTKKKASLRNVLLVMGVLVGLYLAYFIYLLVSGTFDDDKRMGLMVPFIALFATGFPAWNMMKKIGAELSTRAES